MVKYDFTDKNEFIVEDYDKAKEFSSFLPGIAGIDGIPLWSFYVNRGQAIGSFGVRDKNSAIMEFFPANTMYRNVELLGFRTFVRINGEIHEIFSSMSRDKYKRRMMIEQNLLHIEELNDTLNLKLRVTYFTMPQESFAAIVRKVELETIDGSDLDIELVDGLTQLLPYGVTNSDYQSASNLLRAWFDVFNLENKIPYYRVRASVGDSSEVKEVSGGNFYLSISDQHGIVSPIVDTQVLFGSNSACTYPEAWNCEISELLCRRQVVKNKVSGGFTAVKLKNVSKSTLATIIGFVSDIEQLNDRRKEFTLEYINTKEAKARSLVSKIGEDVCTCTSNHMFDKYIEQCYLDNLLRGGYPLVYKAGDRKHVYHVYSRKHGDLEREYNFFSLEPAYYSQGNGNFRDVNQNRRNDIYFKPEIGDFNVRHFMNLIQIDGYNPLLVKGSTFILSRSATDSVLALAKSHKEQLANMVSGRFTPGMIAGFISDNNVQLTVSVHEFIERLLASSEQCFEAEFGEGYWSDHWTYNLDLIESYLQIYPDQQLQLLFGDRDYRFFDSPVMVLPRNKKYVISGNRVRQYGAILEDEEKCNKLNMSLKETNWLKTLHGHGDVYQTNLFTKLVSLALNKFVMLDPYGMGIEMEAEKPGWNDAMNGLPGLFGSSMNETYELRRVVAFVLSVINGTERKFTIPIEIADLLRNAFSLLKCNNSGELSEYTYWDNVAALREGYREKVRFGIDGKELEIGATELREIFEAFSLKLDLAVEKALAYGDGIYPTYFTYEALRYERIEGSRNPVNGYENVRVLEFLARPVPLFLEAPARALTGIGDYKKTSEVYNAIKKSDMYDKTLKMYKTSESLNNASFELGRVTAFTPGWLERESVFMHMEYKYLLAVLKSGLYDEFFEDIKTMLPPFLKPEIYGRSTLENSSFIASSVNPDELVHGRGFVARLTGSTAEMLSMWFIMMAGKQVFDYVDGDLKLQLSPILPSWLFNNEGKVCFKFLGHINVTYHNQKRLNTYGYNSVKINKIEIKTYDKKMICIEGDTIIGEWALAIRNGNVKSLDVYME